MKVGSRVSSSCCPGCVVPFVVWGRPRVYVTMCFRTLAESPWSNDLEHVLHIQCLGEFIPFSVWSNPRIYAFWNMSYA